MEGEENLEREREEVWIGLSLSWRKEMMGRQCKMVIVNVLIEGEVVPDVCR